MCGFLLHTHHQGPGPQLRPDWESNWQPFGSQASAQSTEPHQRGQGAHNLFRRIRYTHVKLF